MLVSMYTFVCLCTYTVYMNIGELKTFFNFKNMFKSCEPVQEP